MKPVTAILIAIITLLIGLLIGSRLTPSSAPAPNAVGPSALPAAAPVAPAPAPAPALAPAAPTVPAVPAVPTQAIEAPLGLDYEGSPAVGDPGTAKVVVVEFSDFQCPVCRRAADELRPLLGSLVKDSNALVIFKQNPLEMHKNAKAAALASAAAHLQGSFWAYHDKLFELNHLLGDDTTYTGIARGLDLDLDSFDATRKSPDLEKRVMAEAQVATDLDARGTPSYFVNGKKQVGWGSAMGLRGMVEAEKREVEKLMAAGKSREDAIAERVKLNSGDKAAVAVKALGL
jgi:protein-disulfide isomerase